MSGKEYNNIIAVDENDTVIAAMPMLEAIEKGYIRRASRAYVLNENGKILIQRRSKNVLKPLMLDPSVGGHVDEGETYLDAAEREMLEELGLNHHIYPLTEISEPYLHNGFFSAMYKVVIPDNLEINFDTEEVAEILWLTPEEVDDLIVRNAAECTPSLVDSWIRFRDKLIST